MGKEITCMETLLTVFGGEHTVVYTEVEIQCTIKFT